MDNSNGTTAIPSVTPAAEHLSTLSTLKEVREKWSSKTRSGTTPTPAFIGGLFGASTKLGIPLPKSIKKTRTRTKTPVM